MNNLTNTISQLLQRGKEGDYWDYKQKWHENNEKLIHDILNFANTSHNHDCYIIFGADDNGRYVTLDGTKRRNQVDMLDILHNCHFAGDNIPEISVETIEINNNILDILIIHNSFNTPFYIKKLNRGHSLLKENYIYARNKDKNTPINQNANIAQIEILWKKRFNLTQPALKQMEYFLEQKLYWQNYENTYYYIYNPSFTVKEKLDFSLKRPEFYAYTQNSVDVIYGNSKLLNNNTVLSEYQTVLLNGIITIVTPQKNFFRLHPSNSKHDIMYCFYLKDSLRYTLNHFYFEVNSYEKIYAHEQYNKVILFFNDTDEKYLFEEYLKENYSLYKEYYLEVKKDDNYYISTDNYNFRDDIQKSLNDGLVLNKMLTEFREKQDKKF